MSQPLTPDLFARYLRILGTPRAAPSQECLSELVAAHLIRVPFENISKLHYRRHTGLCGLPGLERFLDGIERHNFGGTCYTNNYYFNLLLAHLGYDVILCGADMTDPDVHMVSIAIVDGREYLIDVGYAAPFLAPFPRDLTRDYEVTLGRDRYVLKPQDAQGCSRLELYRDGRLKHGYTAKPTPRQIEHFGKVIAHSFTDEATFMNALLLVRFLPESSLMVRNLTLIKSQGTESHIHQITGRAELVELIEEHFAIPRAIVADAIADLGQLQDPWS
ncbi:MAG: arylamine N-acetyltransferase [Candidatus Latescibacterota bacterium]|nr:MAG: arylamine N-acetyltransferase [Candidatus Latescibacterota bacterium]